MRIDLPTCSVRNCKNYVMGNCISKSDYETCPMTITNRELEFCATAICNFIKLHRIYPDAGLPTTKMINKAELFCDNSLFMRDYVYLINHTIEECPEILKDLITTKFGGD